MLAAMSRRIPRLEWCLLPAVLAAGCNGSDTGFTKLRPDIVVLPEVLDFGEVIVGYDATLTLQIENIGRAELLVDDISFEGVPSGAFSLDFEPVEIEPDEIVDVEVVFDPPTYLPYLDTLVVVRADADTPALPVRLSGDGIDGPIPDIYADALSLQYTDVPDGDTDSQLLTLYNVGETDLILGDVTLSGDGAAAFSLSQDLSNKTISADATTNVIVTYTSTSEDGDYAVLSIPSNDPDENPLEVTLLGNNGGGYEYPVALFDCPEGVLPLDTVTFDASDSYDPAGLEPLTFEWFLTQTPDGSTTNLSAAEERASLFVDLAGSWTVALSVANSAGIRSLPTRCDFEVIPEDDLHVELIWTTPDSDLDLHMLDNDAELFETPGDCCYCNKNPSWGATGGEDDPGLDLDDRSGYGPENINIETPAEGVYYLRTHYYEDLGGGTSTATVRFYVYGVLDLELSALMTDGYVWDVAYVDWPDPDSGDLPVIYEESTELYKPSVRVCY